MTPIFSTAGGEIAEHLARDSESSPFIDHVLQTNSAMAPRDYYRLARQHYNAFKHHARQDGTKRDDEAVLQAFEDQHNDALLFIEWSDLLAATGRCPVEVQVFFAWFYASHPDKLATVEDASRFSSVSPASSVSAVKIASEHYERRLSLREPMRL